MAEIRHLIEIDAPSERVFQAIATRDGIEHWWTSVVSGDDQPGGRLRFHLDRGASHAEAIVRERVEGRALQWDFLDANGWGGTCVTFDVEPSGDRSVVRFGHQGWARADTDFGIANYFWGFFMRSLKLYVETGSGLAR